MGGVDCRWQPVRYLWLMTCREDDITATQIYGSCSHTSPTFKHIETSGIQKNKKSSNLEKIPSQTVM